MSGFPRILLLFVALSLVAAPPAIADDSSALDSLNRASRTFNFWLLDWIVEPVARGYNFVMPKWGQARVRNALDNLDRPRDVVNSLLQAKPGRAGRHAAAFAIDSTLGLLGMFALSERWIGLESPETTSETLGVWGLPPGSYIVLPVYGATCPRCLLGAAGDAVLHPLFWIPGYEGIAVRAGASTMEGVNLLARQMPTPFAPEAEWLAYEERFHARHGYEEAKRLFFENLALDVED